MSTPWYIRTIVSLLDAKIKKEFENKQAKSLAGYSLSLDWLPRSNDI